jgi:hypothetical protein
MDSRVVAKLVFHTGRIASRGAQVEGAGAGPMGSVPILPAGQPLLANPVRLPCVPWRDPGHGVADDQKPRNPRLADTHALGGRRAERSARSDRSGPWWSIPVAVWSRALRPLPKHCR